MEFQVTSVGDQLQLLGVDDTFNVFKLCIYDSPLKEPRKKQVVSPRKLLQQKGSVYETWSRAERVEMPVCGNDNPSSAAWSPP